MKVTLYIMTQKGYEVLKAILKKGYKNAVANVIIGRDNNIDNDFANEIITLCKTEKIKFFERKDSYKINSPYSIAISWRWIITNDHSKLIVFHDSLLPKYRGFAPLVNALINKEKVVGVSALFAADEYDTGDIIIQSKLNINYPIKISKAIELITNNYIELALNIFSTLEKNTTIDSKKQIDSLATYSLWRDENDYLINWSNSSSEILCFINAVSTPYKGASTFLNGADKIRIIDAEIIEDVKIENRSVGKVIFIRNGLPVVVCGQGLLKISVAFDDVTKQNILPLKKFRVRFSKNQYSFRD